MTKVLLECSAIKHLAGLANVGTARLIGRKKNMWRCSCAIWRLVKTW